MNRFAKYYVIQVFVFLYTILYSVLLVYAIVSEDLPIGLYGIIAGLWFMIAFFGKKFPLKPTQKEEQDQLLENRVYRTLNLINTKVHRVLTWIGLAVVAFLLIRDNPPSF